MDWIELPMELWEAKAELERELPLPIPLPLIMTKLREALHLINGPEPQSKGDFDRALGRLLHLWDIIHNAFPGIELTLDGTEVLARFRNKDY